MNLRVHYEFECTAWVEVYSSRDNRFRDSRSVVQQGMQVCL